MISSDFAFCEMAAVFNPAAYGRSGWSCSGGVPKVQICSGSTPMWGGVLCNAGWAISIMLAELGMTGSIPTSVGLLSRLNTLDLHSNAIVGVIPSSFGFLDRLQSLRLDSNHLSGRVPSTICNNKELNSMNVGGNQLSCYEPCLSSIATTNFDVSRCTSGKSLIFYFIYVCICPYMYLYCVL